MKPTTSAKRALRGLLCLAAAPMLMGSECEQPLVKDSGFDVWCGNALCNWQVDAGDVVKVPTWHESDYGVGLIGDPAEISQTLSFSSEDDIQCIHFDLIANVDDAAMVTVTMDFDGAVALSEMIPVEAWMPLSYRMVPPSYFRSMRVSIRKTGAGQAQVAQLQASKASDCSGPAPTGELARPAGATCEVAGQCAGTMCRPRTAAGTLFGDATLQKVCAACTSDADCGAGMVCGIGWDTAFIQPFPACAPAAAALLGDRCLVDGECAGGTCCQGVCSTCCATGSAPACAAGTTCVLRNKTVDGKPARTALQCTPDSFKSTAGTACLADDDCASGTCAGGGVLSVCADGRRCASDADCPMGAPGNPCTAIGVAGGKCQ